jgi:hypothetical protein
VAEEAGASQAAEAEAASEGAEEALYIAAQLALVAGVAFQTPRGTLEALVPAHPGLLPLHWPNLTIVVPGSPASSQ